MTRLKKVKSNDRNIDQGKRKTGFNRRLDHRQHFQVRLEKSNGNISIA